jgi:hypothetical protein
MIGSLQLQYNRGRQAVITNELIDIITVSPACFSYGNSADVNRVPRRCKRGGRRRAMGSGNLVAVNAAR